MLHPLSELRYQRALKTKTQTDPEGSDACDFRDVQLFEHVTPDAAVPRSLRDAKVGEKVPFGGKVLTEIKGMGKVYDWRSSSWTPVSGGRIKPVIFVDHIPVIGQMPGITDFITLRNVLVARGLMVQTATDGDGNVALFTPQNFLCYQARGANSFSTGCEHMHYGINDPWSKHQLNAASYIHWRAVKYMGIPNRIAKLGAGNGIVRVLSKGFTTHKAVSDYAGYHDRTDPGPIFERDHERIAAGVRYFDQHRSFSGF